MHVGYRQKSRFWSNSWLSKISVRANYEVRKSYRRPCMQCRSHTRRRTSECLFVTACSMDEYAEEKRTEKNLIVRSGISEAETTNNKRLCSTFCIEAIKVGAAVVQLVEYRTRNREVAGSTHTRSTASNLEQVANLLCAQANSASYPQRTGNE